MTELICWPLDNHQYTSVALGAAYAARSRGILNADSFTAHTNGDNTVTVGKGVGCIHVSDQWAAFPASGGDLTLQLTDADGVYPRWDVIALVYDKNANTAGLEVREGLAAESPALPQLRRDDDYDEIFLYRVTRPVGATKITADNLVDLRLDNTICGLMRDTIDGIDTSVMQKQFEAWLQHTEDIADDLNAEYTEKFTAWFDSMKGQLSKDAAGNLQNQCNELNDRMSRMEYMTLRNDFSAPIAVDDSAILADDAGAAILADWKYKEV